jgi:hypothetical protein
MQLLSEKKGYVITAAIAFIVGLIIGLVVLGWWLWPVKWTDADPVDLRESQKRNYVAMVADSYNLTHDLSLARQRLEGFSEQELSQLLADLNTNYTRQGRGAEANRIKDLANNLGVKPLAAGTPAATLAASPAASAVAAPAATAAATPATAAGGFPWGSLLAVCGILVAVALVVAGGALGWSYLQKQRAAGPAPRAAEPAVAGPEVAAPSGPANLGTFVTTYNLGDASYDDCFPIETPAGDFLGECGVGVSEPIGQGEPALVTAFEVWLFDKSDIRTVTKVLMSQYAYNDKELHDKLAAKGEVILAEPGKLIELETAALKVQAEIKDMAYGAGEGLPAQSHFARLTVELVVSSKDNAVHEAPLAS